MNFDCPAAINDIAAIGSPCEPVQTTQTWPGGSESISVMSINMPSGMVSTPRRRAKSTLFRIDRPSVATRRPERRAASTTC